MGCEAYVGHLVSLGSFEVGHTRGEGGVGEGGGGEGDGGGGDGGADGGVVLAVASQQ